jgi:hypothetical protein
MSKDLVTEKYKAKMKPSTVGDVLSEVYPITLERWATWRWVMGRLNDITRPILDKYGIAGMSRITYYDYGKVLWKLLSANHESRWGRCVEATKNYFITIYDLKSEILDELSEEHVKVIREIIAELKARKNVSTQTRGSDTEQAMGEDKGA